MSRQCTLVVPAIHLNGTSEQNLSENLESAYSAINSAIDELKKTAPNGRDYYVYGNADFEVACDQHRARMLSLQNTLNELDAILGGIAERKKHVIVEVKE